MLKYQQRDEEAAKVSRDATRIERQSALDTSLHKRGEIHPETLTALHNLAEIEAIDNPSESVEHYKKALEGRQKILGDSQPDTKMTSQNLNNLLESLEKLMKCISL